MSIQPEERHTNFYLEGAKTLIQGDQANGSDTSVVIGANNATKDTQFSRDPYSPPTNSYKPQNSFLGYQGSVNQTDILSSRIERNITLFVIIALDAHLSHLSC